MNVGGFLALRLSGIIAPAPGDGTIDFAIDIEPPVLAGDCGLHAQIEHWPGVDEMLAGRQACILRASGFSREELAEGGPAFLGFGQFAIDGRFVIAHGQASELGILAMSGR